MKENRVYKIQPTWTWKQQREAFVLTSPFFGKEISISGWPSDSLSPLFELLELGINSSQLHAIGSRVSSLPSDQVETLVDDLLQKGVVVLASDHDWSTFGEDRLDRQVRFFNSFHQDDRDGVYFNDKLCSKKVAIIGMGGYGNWLALLCARIGIQKIVGIDFDMVEESNLGRQILFSNESIGLPKVEAAKMALEENHQFSNFQAVNTQIKSVKELMNLLDGVDFVFNPFGLVPPAIAVESIAGIVAQAAFLRNIPCLSVGANIVGPMWANKEDPCYFCAITDNHMFQHVTATSNDRPPVLKRQFAPIISTTCSYAVWEAALQMSGASSPCTRGHIMKFDWMSGQFAKTHRVSRSANCPSCS